MHVLNENSSILDTRFSRPPHSRKNPHILPTLTPSRTYFFILNSRFWIPHCHPDRSGGIWRQAWTASRLNPDVSLEATPSTVFRAGSEQRRMDSRFKLPKYQTSVATGWLILFWKFAFWTFDIVSDFGSPFSRGQVYPCESRGASDFGSRIGFFDTTLRCSIILCRDLLTLFELTYFLSDLSWR